MTFLVDPAGFKLELHPRVDAATSLVNHVPGASVATIIGAPTYTAGSMDITGNGAAPKGIDTGYAALTDDVTMLALVDPAGTVAVLASSGTADPWKSIGRMMFDTPGTAADTFSINGQTVTLRAGDAAGFEINIGATRTATAASAAAMINANPGVFGVTAFCPPGNSVIDLKSIAAGVEANLAIGETGSSIRMTSGAYSNAVAMVGGAAGDAVTMGLYVSGGSFVYRNTHFGAGGLPAVPIPATAGHFFIAGRARKQDYAEIILVTAGGVISGRSFATSAGRARRANAPLQAGQAGGGSGTANVGFLAVCERLMGDDELIANYNAIKPLAEAAGLTVN